MAIVLNIPPPLRPYAEGTDKILLDPSEAPTIRKAIETLVIRHPGLNDRMFSGGQLRPFVNVYLNNEDVRFLDNEFDAALKDGDDVAIIPAVGGG
ncbi:MAG: MoaD/ThiS family protein [Planctomycetota bacterium]|nr:MoaD/ThiS family protein [Planctomycetota bacterium]